jgi:hypothetical protein
MGTMEEAAEKFERWRECRSLLEKKTRVLQKEMDEFLAGKRAMPTDLLADVLELQKKSVALFKQVVKSMSTP